MLSTMVVTLGHSKEKAQALNYVSLYPEDYSLCMLPTLQRVPLQRLAVCHTTWVHKRTQPQSASESKASLYGPK